MANPNHVAMLKKGVTAWNKWRAEAPGIGPDLADLDLTTIAKEFLQINFQDTILTGANLIDLNLTGSDLRRARLVDAQLRDAKINGADIRRANFDGADVEGIKFDRKLKCLGARVEGCIGSPRFKRHVIEEEYIAEFEWENPRLSTIWRCVSDYSRDPIRIASVGLLFILAFSITYYLLPNEFHWPGSEHGRPTELWFAPIYFSVVTFTTLGYGDIYPTTTAGEILATSEVIFGYIWLGFLVSVIASRASARV